MNKKRKKNFKKLIIIIGIALGILVGVISFKLITSTKINYINSSNRIKGKYLTAKNEYAIFEKYSGNVDPMVFEKSIWYVSNVSIPQIAKTENIDDYYSTNMNDISTILGIDSKEEFLAFSKYIKQKVKNRDLKVKTISVLDSSIKRDENGEKFILEFAYEDEIKIYFYTTLKMRFNSKSWNLKYLVDDSINEEQVANELNIDTNVINNNVREIEFTGR